MTISSRTAFAARSFLVLTAFLGSLVLGSAPALAQAQAREATVTKKTTTSLQLGVSTPLVVPFGYNASVGVGVLPGIQLSLGEHFGINLTSGYIHYVHSGDYTEREVPVLLGASYVFMDPHTRARPYLTAKLGYTNSRRDGHTSHWATAAVGGGALIRLGRGFALDLGGDLVVSDLGGGADDPLGLLLKVGLTYRL